MARGRRFPADSARIWGLNFRLSTGVLNEASAEMAGLGLDVKEFFVLDGVDEEPYPAQIARRLSMPKPTVAAHLRSLERKQLLSRAIDPDDLRRHRLILTNNGRMALDAARRVLTERYAARLARLSEEERSSFADLLEKLSQ